MRRRGRQRVALDGQQALLAAGAVLGGAAFEGAQPFGDAVLGQDAASGLVQGRVTGQELGLVEDLAGHLVGEGVEGGLLGQAGQRLDDVVDLLAQHRVAQVEPLALVDGGPERVDEGGRGVVGGQPGDVEHLGGEPLGCAALGPADAGGAAVQGGRRGVQCCVLVGQGDDGVGEELAQDRRRQPREALDAAVQAQVAAADDAQADGGVMAGLPQAEHLAADRRVQVGAGKRAAFAQDLRHGARALMHVCIRAGTPGHHAPRSSAGRRAAACSRRPSMIPCSQAVPAARASGPSARIASR